MNTTLPFNQNDLVQANYSISSTATHSGSNLRTKQDKTTLHNTDHKLSTKTQIQRQVVLGIAKVLPQVAKALTWHHFIHPRKARAYTIEDLPAQAFPLSLQHRGQTLNGYRWGSSEKRIYLVHGWESNVSKMKHFVQPLLNLGYQVIAFDLPAHGNSTHKDTNFKDWMNALETIMRTYGKAHGVIAHSCGATMTVNMLAKNPDLTPEKLSLISPMLSAKTHIDVFSSVVGLPTYLIDMLISRLERTTELNLEDTCVTSLIQNIKADGLICHDHDDTYISYDYGKAIAKAWENAKLYSSHKLGHRRILKNTVVIDKIVQHTIT